MKKEFLKNGLFCYTDDDHKFTLDSLILARLIPDFKYAAELCAGMGVIGLSVLYRGERIHFVEISESACTLLSMAIEEQRIENSKVFCADARDFANKNTKKYDTVFFNPPYYKTGSGKLPENAEIAMQRFELRGELNEFILAAKQLLTDSGKLLFSIKPERKNEAMRILLKNGFYINSVSDFFHNEENPSFLTVFSAAFAPTNTTFDNIFLKVNGQNTQFFKNL